MYRDEIRIILIHKGNREDHITCSMDVFPMENLPEYEALSYRWSSQANPGQITLNGQPYMITQNLRDALRRLRSSTDN
jgi:heterokaryon incompatibility protein (HET)